MKTLKIVGIVIGIILLLVLSLVIFVVKTDYVPEKVEEHAFEVNASEKISTYLEVTIFNIGYCGLDEGQDFFMDGGTGSRSSSKEQTIINLEKNIENMKLFDSDIYMLQEVDVEATRSYKVNEYEAIKNAFSEYSNSFVYNYKVKWVPVPFNLPMGKVESGLLTLVNGKILSATRYSLPNDETIPDKYFLLDRCIDEVIVEVENGKRLHVFNLHLSAYDSGGVIKKEQMEWIKEFIDDLYMTKDYYIFGGDWNQLLSEDIVIDKDIYFPEWLGEPPHTFDGTGFKWGYDITTNTVRDLYEPYIEGSTFETVIDGFLVSPNIEIISVVTNDLGFANSDHHPVTIKIKLE